MRETVTDRFLKNVWVTVVARATLLVMPLVVSFVTWMTWEVFTRLETAIKQNSLAIAEMQKQIQDHEFRIQATRAAHTESQSLAAEQYARFDKQLDIITNKLTETNNSVIRVQTIIETRLPPSQ